MMISVVIPAYNAEDTIEKAVDSVLDQTEKDLEIVAVDDGSTDRTGQILDELCRKDPRIRIIHQANGGVSRARNAGIRAAKGKYLMTLDDDDTISPCMLETMRKEAEKSGSDLVICGIRLVYPDHTESFEAKEAFSAPKDRFLQEKMAWLYDNHLLTTHSNKLYDLDLIRKKGVFYDPALQINEDSDFVLRYLAHCKIISLIPGAYLDYYQHGIGQSLITTFRDNGVSSALKLKEDLDALYRGIKENERNTLLVKEKDSKTLPASEKKQPCSEDRQFEKLRQDMDHRILVHILSCAGLMYTRSGMKPAEIRREIEVLCKDRDLQELLERTKPEDLKTAAAAVLLKHHQAGLYDLIARMMYR